MTLIMLTLGQLTLLLVLAIAVSGLLSASASRAHRVLLVGLLCVVIMPLFSWSVDQMGWGLITPPAQPTQQSARAIPDKSQPEASPQPSAQTDMPSSPMSPVPELAHSAAMNHQTPGMTAEPPAASLQTLPAATDDTAVQPEPQPISPSQVAPLPGPPLIPANSVTKNSPWYSAVPWWALLIATWAAGSLWLLLRLVIGGLSALRITRTSQPAADNKLQAALSRACRDLGITRPVQLRRSERIGCPVISGWGQPMIIIPADYNQELDWRAILTHELAHWKRRDHWSALLAETTRCLLPWHPLVHYCCYRMYRLSEIACDAWAVRFADAPEKFAESLIAFAPNPRRPGFSSMATRHSNIKERVSLILSESGRTPRAGSAFTALIVVLATMSFVLTGLLRTHAPVASPHAANEESANVAESESAENTEDKTDEEWVQHLTSVPDTARWYAGRNLGAALAQLPEGRGFRILESCWDDIEISVRKQILKGYYSFTELNSHFFQVMNLGMSSADSGSRSFAASYLEGVIHRNFESDLDGYRQWYETTSGMLADEIVAREIQSRLDEAQDPATRNVHGLISNIIEHQMMYVEMPVARDTLLDGGILQLLAAWQDEGFLIGSHEVFDVVTRAHQRAEAPAESESSQGLTLESSDDEWIGHLKSIPNEARWHVGANLGAAMSGMDGDRPLRILRNCWNDIGPEVRRQILKGFTPGFFVDSLNANYFEIQELGLRSPEPEVQDTARTYLEWMTLEKFASVADYESWREATRGKTYEQLMADRAIKMVEELGGDTIGLETQLRKISEGSRHSPVFKQALAEAGLTAKLDMLLRNGQIPFTNPVIGTLLNELSISPQAMRVALDPELKKMVDMWEASVADEEDASALRSDLWTISMNLGETKYPYIIPTMIGLIDADNSYDTVYGVGYFGLSGVTGVPYRKYHDGAWWRRWWEENKETLPEAVQEMKIPMLTKSAHGKGYVPFPEGMERLDVKLDWMLERQKAGLDFGAALDEIEDEHSDPSAIPVLIGVLDADNSSQMISDVGSCLRAITGVQYTRLSDGAWWRRWWEKNKESYPPEVQGIAIPDLPKTLHGETYEPVPEILDTLDGKIEFLANHEVSEELYERIIDGIDRGDSQTLTAADIPKLIGIIDADNSSRTVRWIGGDSLAKLTGVSYSPTHDGAWWRRWWEANKNGFPESVRNIPIPELPKTEFGKTYVAFPADLETIDQKIEYLNSLKPTDKQARESIINSIEYLARNTPRPDTDIPKYIGLIDSDNSYDTVFGIGAYLLRDVTGVDYNPYHDGPWWRRWWQRNKSRYSEEAQRTPIPDITKTSYAQRYEPYPATLDTLEGKIEWVGAGCPSWSGYEIEYLSNALCEHNDARAIPVLIGWMLADESTRCLDMREESWERMTGIDTNDSQTPQWWAQWWTDNKSKYPEDAQNTPIPVLTAAVASFRDGEKLREARRQEQEFEGIPAEQRTIGGDEKKMYFQIGPREGATMPEAGWKVLLILPGGDGSAEFHPFCRRIHMHALPHDYVAVQLVAPVWPDDGNRVVWPTEKLNPQQGEFTTEQFIKAAVEDLKTHIDIDEQNVFALGWSSGGPPLYVNSVLDDSPVTGTFVAMSVFHPQNISDISGAEGHPYFILHSPGDWIPIDQHARVAVEQLGNAGAKTRLQLYSGGHGWVDDPYGNIRRGIQWLQENVEGDE